MNDYKELLKELRKLQNLGDAPIGREFAVIVDKLTVKDAADAIEQLARDNNVLTKERDEFAKTSKQFEGKCKQLERERDAAVDDLEQLMHTYAGTVCFYCKHYNDRHCDDCVLGNKWQWRGVQEVDVE